MGRRPARKEVHRGGSWTAEEDRRLAQTIEIHGPRMWKIVAAEAGLNRGGRSCRLRWLNYLSPNIKRGNISDQEEDLILRLHRLLGNRWSLIAGRLPGRTDNEIKNYWNTHLSRKAKQTENPVIESREEDSAGKSARPDETESNDDGVEEWMSSLFMEMDNSWFDFCLPD